MKEIGIVRKIDELGRIVIPKEIRDRLNWVNGNMVEILGKNDGVMIRTPNERGCSICNIRDVFYIEIHEKKICKSCIKEINKY